MLVTQFAFLATPRVTRDGNNAVKVIPANCAHLL